MCLLVLAWRSHPRYRLVVAANRDEFHVRAATPLGIWGDQPRILGGRDQQAGGTWFAVDQQRRFGVITNFREPARARPGAPSRGNLIPQFLASTDSPQDYLSAQCTSADAYAGFSLLLADSEQLCYASNRGDRWQRELPAGMYGLSNHFLDTPWPKLLRVRAGLTRHLAADDINIESLLVMLADDQPSPHGNVPDVEMPADWARALSSPFVRHGSYGTRCSTVLLLEHSGAMQVVERRFDAGGAVVGEAVVALLPGEWPGVEEIGVVRT